MYTIDATLRGVKGDGTSDDGPALQECVDSLTETGGTIWLPPNRHYAIGTKVQIKSKYAIWIVSQMAGRLLGGGGATTHGNYGLIRPLNDTLGYLFEWDRPNGLLAGEGGGGGIQGLVIADWVMPSTGRSKAIDGAVNLIAGAKWHCFDCTFEWINGRALRIGDTDFCTLRDVKVYTCGAAGKPPIDIDGEGDIGQVWWDRGWLEQCQYDSIDQVVRINADCILYGNSLYFENSLVSGDVCPFVDATEEGGMDLSGCIFAANEGEQLIIGGEGSRVRNSTFSHAPTSNDTIQILSTAAYTQLQNLWISAGGQTGRAIRLNASFCQVSGIHLQQSGGIGGTGVSNSVQDVYLHGASASLGQWAIDAIDNWLVSGALVDLASTTGSDGAACDGIKATNASVVGSRVLRKRTGKDGITFSGSTVDSGNYIDTQFG